MLHANSARHTALASLLPALALLQRFDEATIEWHESVTDLAELPLKLHRANFDLWHLEDSARDLHATDAVIAGVKRGIDRTNQQRNDFVEQLDTSLLAALQPHDLPQYDAPMHSETPGMILDRLSILSLKRFHMNEQAQRKDASVEHRKRSADRLEILDVQSHDLVLCLEHLWSEVCLGTRRFAIYHQMKMYNDPTLNPVLYAAGTRTPAVGS